MKKTLFRLFAALPLAATLVLPAVALAAGPSLNKNAGDLEFLTGRNTSAGQTNFTDPVYANAGQEVEVNVYYHNTGEETDAEAIAKNLKLQVTLPTVASTKQVIKASLSADNHAAITGTIVNGVEKGQPDFTILATSPVTTQFVAGSVKWFPENSDTNGAVTQLPGGVNGDTVVTTGLSLGDEKPCFNHQANLRFKVKLVGQVVNPPSISLKKEVRKAGTTTAFLSENTINSGERVEYRIAISNIDGAATATNIKVQDTLPAGFTYVGPTTIRYTDGTSKNAPDGITADGIIIDALAPQQSLEIFFQVNTPAKDINNNECRVNKVRATSDSVKNTGIEATAKTCVLVPSPTPTPVVTPTPSIPPAATPTPAPATPVPTPTPVLPKTGGEVEILLAGAGVSGVALAAMRSLRRSGKSVAKSKTDIL